MHQFTDSASKAARRESWAMQPTRAQQRVGAAAPAPAYRPCSCGGGCPACASRRIELRGFGSSGDNEAEAERASRAAIAAAPAAGPPPRALPPTPAAIGIATRGRPLPATQRNALEQAYGWQLDSVRVHDAPAERGRAHAIGARAFTSGSHIVHAGRGREPEPQVLAHEAAHVVQTALHPGAPRVQRYESPEHEDLGDAALDELLAFLQTPEGVDWARTRKLDATALVRSIQADPLRQAGGKIRVGRRAVGQEGTEQAVDLTPGQIVALAGDFFAGPEAITAAASRPLAKPGDANEIDRLQTAIGEERKGKLDDPNRRYEELTGGRYLKLAKQNDEHFAPLNRREWRRLHEQALAEATAAGVARRAQPAKFAGKSLADDAALQHALLVDAAGGHFLTDAYASGHLFRKNELLAAIRLHLAAHPLRTGNPEAQTYAGIVTASGNADQLVLKNIHDRLNREGFDVTNGRGMAWRTFGDAQLAKAPDTQRIASLALFLSRQQVYAAHRGETPDSKEVEDLMPDDATLDRATRTAIGYIPAAASAGEIEGLMYRGRKLAGTQFPWPLGPVIQSNLSTVANPGRERQLLDLQQSSTSNPGAGPRLAPQFTLWEF